MHRRFSFRRVLVLAANTFTQLVRMKVFFVLAVFAVLLIGASFIFAGLKSEQELKMLKDLCLAAMSLFSMLFAVAATSLLLPRDIEDRTLYTILCKPVPRLEYLLGKLFGVAWLILISLIVMNLLFTGVLWLKHHMIVSEQLSLLEMNRDRMPAAQFAEEQASIISLNAKQGLTWGLQAGVYSIFLKAFVLAGVALLMSTVASTTMFTIISSLCILVIGHGQAIAREYFLAGSPAGSLPNLLAGIVAIIFPDFRSFDIMDAVVLGTPVSAGALLQMTGLAAVYFVVHMLASYFIFAEKEL